MDSPPLPTYTYAYTSPTKQPKPQAPTSSHAINAPPSPAPSDPTTPYHPSTTTTSSSSSPIYKIPPTPTPEPGASRPTTLIYGNRLLQGSLYYITSSDFLNKLFARFLDIDAASEPAVEDVRDPYLLVHCVMGRSWCDGRLLPKMKEGERFVAVTDDWGVFEEEERMEWEAEGKGEREGLGRCGLDGTYTPSTHLTIPTSTLQPSPNTFPGFLTPEENPSHPSIKSNNLLLA
ncbi:hypothetical protein KC345_g7765, partial [Hortaea werneckii]